MPPIYWSTASQWSAIFGSDAAAAFAGSVKRTKYHDEFDEGVHRVGFARRRPAALRARDVLPGRMAVERIARLIERHVLRQLDRQVRDRDRHDAARFAMDDRDRAAPIALSRNAPVPELVIDLALRLRPIAEGDLLEPARDLFLRRLDRHSVEEARIDHHTVAIVGGPIDGEVGGIELGGHTTGVTPRP